MRFFLLTLKNLTRNKLRTFLTTLAVIVLVYVYTMIVTVVGFLESFTVEKSKDVKLIINERFRLMSNFDRRYMDDIASSNTELGKELRQIKGFDPDKATIWHFVGFTLDPEMKDNDKVFFAVATFPDKIRTMTDNLKPEEFDLAWVEAMRNPPNLKAPSAGMVMGGTIAKKLNLRVGDRITALSNTHFDGTALRKPIKMEFELVGILPEDCSWNDASFIDTAYLDTELKKQNNEFDGKVSYGWLQVDDQKSAEEVSAVIERHVRELRCETSATAYGRFMAPLKNVFWAVKFILVPAIMIVMTIILANTIYLTVRDRQTEIAVLKVLGFRTVHILMMVLGEACLVGFLAGLLGAALTYFGTNSSGGIHLPQMPILKVADSVFLSGPLIGIGTGLLGGIIPAVMACRIKVTDAFSSTE